MNFCLQLLDLPGIIEGAKDGKGRGRQVISTARTCNCILIVLDAIKPITHKRLIEKELEGFGIRFVLLHIFYSCACSMPILFLNNLMVHF